VESFPPAVYDCSKMQGQRERKIAASGKGRDQRRGERKNWSTNIFLKKYFKKRPIPRARVEIAKRARIGVPADPELMAQKGGVLLLIFFRGGRS